MKKRISILVLALLMALTMLVSGCSSVENNDVEENNQQDNTAVEENNEPKEEEKPAENVAKEGKYIITADAALKVINEEGTVLVDAQGAEDYANAHIDGAVNIARADITVSDDVPNVLAPEEKIEDTFSKSGISNDTMIVIYDNNNNMDSGRLWWTLMVYGHENVKVVSGGLEALKGAGLETSTEVPEIVAGEYTIDSKNEEWIASLDEVMAQVNDPKEDVVLLDTRSPEEYTAGTIPGSIHLNYIDNNNADGTYKSVKDIKAQYEAKGITPDKTIIMYCKTSIRGAQTLLALYEAGYENLKLYDGAWVEYSADSSLPVETPSEDDVDANEQDLS